MEDTLGSILFAWRKAQGFNKSEAAKAAGVAVSHWWEMENEKTTELRDDTFAKLAEVTGVAENRLRYAAAVGHARKRLAELAVATQTPSLA